MYPHFIVQQMETEKLNTLSRVSDFPEVTQAIIHISDYQLSVPSSQNLSSVTGTLVNGEA